jgi:hypothetical protein
MVFFLGIGGIAGPAAAQQPSPTQVSAIRSSCRADYQAHCAGVPTGGQASLACLQENMASLSPNCRQAVGAIGGGASAPASAGAGAAAAPAGAPAASGRHMPPRAEVGMLREECGADYQTHCRGVLPGGGRGLACLADRRESLSHGCREAMQSLRQGR